MAQADDSDTTNRADHIKRMLARLAAQQEEAASEKPTDIMTELSTMADVYLALSRLDREAQQPVLSWLDARSDDEAAPLRF
jgi:hypothetical protein